MKHALAFWCCLHLAFIYTVEGVTMSISPPSVYLQYSGQGQMPQTTFLCAGISASDVSVFDSLTISRLTRRESPSQQHTIIAFITPNAGASIPPVQATTDIQNRAAVSGTVDSLDVTQSNLQLQFDTNSIQCDDVGQYTCTFTYRDSGFTQHIVESSTNLSVNALPAPVTLSARSLRFGATVEGPVNNPYEMNEGDEIEFTCNGDIGSNPNLPFEWWITGNMGYIKFRPASQPNAVETPGETIPGSTACTYSRTTTMRYNITATDRSRGSLTFMCFAQVTPPSPAQQYQQNSTAFYINIAGGGVGPNPDQVATAGGTDAGVIAGSVVGVIAFIVIVVLLVYFLWYRRRGGSDTYKTREETDGSNPNLAPTAADLYATPNKDRNRNQPDSSNMNTPPKPKPRAKKGKELHYAELDIASNVPMVPPKPSHDRVEYAEVQFNKHSDYEHPV